MSHRRPNTTPHRSSPPPIRVDRVPPAYFDRHKVVSLPQRDASSSRTPLRVYSIPDCITLSHPAPSPSPFDRYQAIAASGTLEKTHTGLRINAWVFRNRLLKTTSRKRSMISCKKSTSPGVNSFAPILRKPQLRLLHLRFPKTMACATSNLPEDPPLAHSLESTIGQLILAHQDLISMSILIPIVLVCWMLMTESTSYGFLFVTSPLF